jgi:hypothetical protein
MLFVPKKQARNVLELMKKYLIKLDASKSRRKKEKTFVLK